MCDELKCCQLTNMCAITKDVIIAVPAKTVVYHFILLFSNLIDSLIRADNKVSIFLSRKSTRIDFSIDMERYSPLSLVTSLVFPAIFRIHVETRVYVTQFDK